MTEFPSFLVRIKNDGNSVIFDPSFLPGFRVVSD